ncbi:unnamed protein product, partial [Rotaria sp. Silwood2]
MDDWRIQQQRINTNGIGPIHSYHSLHSRPSPYQINEIKQTYPYQQSSAISVKTDSNSDVYTPLPYIPTHIEQIHPQQRIIASKSNAGPISTYHPGHQQMMSARARSMPYPSPSMYTHSSPSVCQCNSHIHYPSQHQMFYQNYYPSQPISYQQNSNITKYDIMKNKIKSKNDESFQSSSSYYSSICSNSYIPAQQLQSQLSSISPEYQIYSNQSQIFPSPPSNPSTPHQGEFNGNTDFGVPYHQSQPSSVNSLTDALCPSGDTIDRQMTPGPPSVGTPRVAQNQYSFPHTPLTPTTTSRLTNEQNI